MYQEIVIVLSLIWVHVSNFRYRMAMTIDSNADRDSIIAL